MNDLLALIPKELQTIVTDMYVDYEGMRHGSNEWNAWVMFPCYTCTIESDNGMLGVGIASINEKTTPEEARLLAIERAVENLLEWIGFQKQQEGG